METINTYMPVYSEAGQCNENFLLMTNPDESVPHNVINNWML